jgi:phosphoglycolate phosphatase-like HAD superfamily hydrolase
MTRRLVLFDIDGTLLLSCGAGRRAIMGAIADEIGLTAAALDRIRFDGKTDPQIVTELLLASGEPAPPAPERIARVLDRYLHHLEADLAINAHRAELMPGVPALLDLLEGDTRTVLGLLTGNISGGAALKLRAVRLEPARFRVGAYGSDHAVRAELPAIAAERAAPHFGRPVGGREVVIIGDTPADVTCGRGIGARSIAVATGSFSAGELRAAGADLVFDDFADAARACAAILDDAL